MEWFIYLLKVSACAVLFLGFYLLCLKRLTFFKLNRFYLLVTLVISFIIPAFHFTLHKETEAVQITDAPQTAQTALLPVVKETSLKTAAYQPAPVAVSKKINWQALAICLYAAVALILIFRRLMGFKQLLQCIKGSAKYIYKVNGMKLIPKATGFTNCSFFNYVFVDENAFTETELQLFLRHEEAHIKQYHSVDNILLLFARAVLWFNPIIYLYNKELEQAHEFEADEITSQNFGAQHYATLLLNLAVNKSQIPLAHHFAKSPVKNRIKMLFNPKTNKMKKAIYLLSMLICAGLVFLFSVRFVYAQTKPVPATISPIEMNQTSGLITKDSLETFTVDAAVNDDIVKKGSLKTDTISPPKTTAEPKKDTIIIVRGSNKTGTILNATNIKVDDYTILNADTVRVSPNYRKVSLNAGEQRATITYRSVAGRAIIEDQNGCKVTSIECDHKNTIVSFEYTAPSDGSWVLLNKEMYLQSSNDMKHFQYIKSEGIPLMPEKHYFEKAGDKLAFKVYFEKVPQTAKWIDIIERAGRSNYFNFYNVPLPPNYYETK